MDEEELVCDLPVNLLLFAGNCSGRTSTELTSWLPHSHGYRSQSKDRSQPLSAGDTQLRSVAAGAWSRRHKASFSAGELEVAAFLFTHMSTLYVELVPFFTAKGSGFLGIVWESDPNLNIQRKVQIVLLQLDLRRTQSNWYPKQQLLIQKGQLGCYRGTENLFSC